MASDAVQAQDQRPGPTREQAHSHSSSQGQEVAAKKIDINALIPAGMIDLAPRCGGGFLFFTNLFNTKGFLHVVSI